MECETNKQLAVSVVVYAFKVGGANSSCFF